MKFVVFGRAARVFIYIYIYIYIYVYCNRMLEWMQYVILRLGVGGEHMPVGRVKGALIHDDAM